MKPSACWFITRACWRMCGWPQARPVLTAVGTIIDDELPVLQLSRVGSAAAMEGTARAFSISLSQPQTEATALTVSFSGAAAYVGTLNADPVYGCVHLQWQPAGPHGDPARECDGGAVYG